MKIKKKIVEIMINYIQLQVVKKLILIVKLIIVFIIFLIKKNIKKIINLIEV